MAFSQASPDGGGGLLVPDDPALAHRRDSRRRHAAAGSAAEPRAAGLRQRLHDSRKLAEIIAACCGRGGAVVAGRGRLRQVRRGPANYGMRGPPTAGSRASCTPDRSSRSNARPELDGLHWDASCSFRTHVTRAMLKKCWIQFGRRHARRRSLTDPRAEAMLLMTSPAGLPPRIPPIPPL